MLSRFRLMIRPTFTLLTAALCAAAATAQARDSDFPTVDRVFYVQECIRNHPGPNYEMVNKCSCALDRLTGELSFDEYVALNTAANATTIGGERGGVLRENESVQAMVKHYRTLQTKVKKACFVTP